MKNNITMTHEQKVTAAKAYRYLLSAVSLLEKAFDCAKSPLLETQAPLYEAIERLGDLFPTPKTCIPQVRKALNWKDPLANIDQSKMTYYILKRLNLGWRLSDEEWDFVVGQLKEYRIARLARVNSKKVQGELTCH
jgi:hypothetical protein